MLCYENRNYLLCTLKKGSIFQVPLDLNFQEGTKIAFTCNGHGHVHLTGYLALEDLEDYGDMDEELEEEEEEEEEEEVPQLVKSKRNATECLKKTSKKVKQEDNDVEDSSEEFDSSDSDDEEQAKMIVEGEEEDDSDDEEDEDSEDEPEPEVVKSKQKQRQDQQAQNQVGKKEKQKMVNGKDAKQDLSTQKKNKTEQQQQNSQQAKKRTIEGGIIVEDLLVGKGAPAKPGKFVSVFYVGRLKNGKKFDETKSGEGFKFQLGKGEVIKGWDIGIHGMKIGGKRRLTLPPSMAYVIIFLLF